MATWRIDRSCFPFILRSYSKQGWGACSFSRSINEEDKGMDKGARTDLLTGTFMVGVLVAIFLTIISIGAKAQAEVLPGDAVLAAAGDIGDCTSLNDDEATAALLADMPGATVAALGDNAYPDGSASDYQNCYDPSWGAYKYFGDGSPRTRPTAGNHDYHTAGASGYFDYFGAAAGDRTKGYYSYDLGSWHVVVLNSNCTEIGGCSGKSPQVQWLKSDLAAHPSACTLAYWHAPRFSSSQTGTPFGPFWNTLYKAKAEVVLNSHKHNYERFAEQTPGGVAAPGQGIREFVVGTGGGESLYPFKATMRANSEVGNASTLGVLKLTLHADSYDWQFVPVAGQSFTDSGTTNCH
jgi:hypothetical protein